ncbi:MAG: glycosyltransferase family 9 protein [Actinomycetales bacterium]
MTRVLLARLDSAGDVLLTGPAVQAVAARSEHITLLVSPAGAAAAALLPGVDDRVVWDCPWTGFGPPPVDAGSIAALVDRLRGDRYDLAVICTSDHQSPLPLALLLRQAGIGRIVAASHDYPGSLLDVRHPPGGPHEVERNLSLVEAAGFPWPGPDGPKLALRQPYAEVPPELARLRTAYVVVHPAASVPARSIPPVKTDEIVAGLVRAGFAVVLTGEGGRSRPAPAHAPADSVLDLVGHTTLAELAAVLAGAMCLVAGNTGPAHLAAAVGTPVVSLFAPVVPASAWAPWGVPSVLLGDQDAPCAGTRARDCPVPGHPCLNDVPVSTVVAAVTGLVREVAA